MSQIKAATTEIRRFGYYIPQSNGTVDFVVNTTVLDGVTLAELHKIVRVVFELQPIIVDFKVVERNYRELIDSAQEYVSQLNKLTPSLMVPISLVMEGLISASQRVNNLLSSASSFLAHTETNLRHIHGKDSSEFTTWDEMRKNIHATSFSYRFLYELRNYAQHRNIPISRINIDSKRLADVGPIAFKVNLLILRDELLGAGYDWKKLKTEIKQQPPEIDLLPLAEEYLHGLCQICLDALKLQSTQLTLCGQYFDAWIGTMNMPVGAIPVVYIGVSDSPENVPSSRYDIIPMEQYQYILREYDQLVKACGL